jgi:DNA modification methylase
MRAVFAQVWRVMRSEATLFVNVGDAYAGSSMTGGHGKETLAGGIQWQQETMFQASRKTTGLKPKSLLGLPWRLALALQADGWILRSEIIWAKKNCMPESVQDRVVRAHEQIFMFAKQPRYYFDGENIREPHADFQRGNAVKHAQYGGHRKQGYEQEEHIIRWAHDESQRSYNPNGRACRSVWSLASEPTPYAHFATFPTELVRKCLLAGAPHAVCSMCGKPWVRQMERTYYGAKGPVEDAMVVGMRRNQLGGQQAYRTYQPPRTTGFSPSCACNAPTRRSVILDPFAGSGTVGLVARELGHDAVCLDLSLSYLRDIARERLGLAALTRWTDGAAPRPETHTDLPLFATLDSPG